MFITALNGMCMALADSVPGVSGGTIAFILGFYDRFINALHSLFDRNSAARGEALRYLAKLGLGWCIGMGTSVVLLSSLFEQNIYFMSSLFLGLTLTSIPVVLLAEKETMRGKLSHLSFTVIGVIVVAGIALLRSGSGIIGGIDFTHMNLFSLLFVFVAGMFAISAMVLPGISGSTVLLICGVYLPAISAAKELLHLNLSVLPGVMALGFGILFGIGASIHVIRNALEKHRSQMVYLIFGMMLGSLVAIVMGPTTLAVPLASLSISTFHPVGFLLGLAILAGLELLKTKMPETSAQKLPKKTRGVSSES